jgi:hypothetical protein
VLFGGWEPCSKTAFRGRVGAVEKEYPTWLSGYAGFDTFLLIDVTIYLKTNTSIGKKYI